jgi:hypothetical protein
MKTSLLAVALLAFLLFGGRSLQAQAYGPYYYNPYWEVPYYQYLEWQQYLAYLQQYDPYYELHVMHYQLYLPQYQPYQQYPHCCYAGGIIVPDWSVSISPQPRPVMNPRLGAFIGSRSQAAASTMSRSAAPLPGGVSSLPRATGSLPKAVAPLPPATGRR